MAKEDAAQVQKIEEVEDLKADESSDDEGGQEVVEMTEDQKAFAEAAGLGEQVINFIYSS